MAKEPQDKVQEYAIAPASFFKPISQLPRVVDEVVSTGTIYSTYDLSKPENRGPVYDQLIMGGKPADQFIGEQFEIKHLTVFPVTFTDKNTGEVVQMPLCLITTDAGETIQFVSKGIWGSLLMIMACGYAPFGPARQKFKLVQVPVGDGKRFYQLHRVVEVKAK